MGVRASFAGSYGAGALLCALANLVAWILHLVPGTGKLGLLPATALLAIAFAGLPYLHARRAPVPPRSDP